ncbi:MAG: hypothetical protein ACJAYU_001084 [Bradymonadia bacterium]
MFGTSDDLDGVFNTNHLHGLWRTLPKPRAQLAQLAISSTPNGAAFEQSTAVVPSRARDIERGSRQLDAGRLGRSEFPANHSAISLHRTCSAAPNVDLSPVNHRSGLSV